MYKNGPRQGKHLRFILQPPESRGENKAIVIAQKRGTDGIGISRSVFRTASFGAEKLLPVHHVDKNNRKRQPVRYNRPLLQKLVTEGEIVQI